MFYQGLELLKRGITALKEKDLYTSICDYIKADNPFLGICLGMQLLMTRSFEFGEHDGLNIISGSSKKNTKKIRMVSKIKFHILDGII